MALVFAFIGNAKDLFRTSHACRVWRDTIMHSHALNFGRSCTVGYFPYIVLPENLPVLDDTDDDTLNEFCHQIQFARDDSGLDPVPLSHPI
ncbi:hypothetical protein GGF32_004042 [Allomyces javanicus]|nr:hypothetical protein GGF32_004042 [Allomyces javanicus]